jgi:hypothetical protein
MQTRCLFWATSQVGQASACLVLNFAALAEVKRRQAEQAAEKLKTPSFRGSLFAEESLFSWI